MSNTNDFLKNFKIKKALGDYSESLNYGDKIHMFNCLYKVASFEKSGYTILEDEKNGKFAIPSNKLMLLLKKGVARNTGAINILKAFKVNIGGPSAKAGSTSAQANARGKAAFESRPSPTGQKQQGIPVGTQKQFSDGEWYMKVSANPSEWRHVTQGTLHDDSGKKKEALHNPKEMEHFNKLLVKLEGKTHPEDHDKIKNKLKEVWESKRKAKDFIRNHPDKKAAMGQHDAFRQKFKELREFLKESVKKKLTKNSSNKSEDKSVKQGKETTTIEPKSDAPNVKVNSEHGQKIAKAYDQMKHDPKNPEVKAAYGALVKETGKQYQELLDKGFKFSPIKSGEASPYKNSSDVHSDIEKNKHLWYYPTEQGFGSEGETPKDHPMLSPTPFKHGDKVMPANDIFRIVHDINGHYNGGKSGFGPKGEHQAFLTHKQTFSPLAQKALATETLGQNSFVNFGPNAKHNRANPSKTIYAEQKAGLLPKDIIEGKWHE